MRNSLTVFVGLVLWMALNGCAGEGGHDDAATPTDLPSEDAYFKVVTDSFFTLGKIERVSAFPHTGPEWHTEVTQLEGNEQVAAVGKYVSDEVMFYIIATAEERHYEFFGLLWDRRESRFTQVIPLQYDYNDEDKRSELRSLMLLDSSFLLPNIIQQELEDAQIVGTDSTGYSSSGTKTFWKFDGSTYTARPFKG